MQKTAKHVTLDPKKMSYDPSVPTSLLTTQQWFASMITQPLHTLRYLPKVTPRGKLLEKEAEQIIKPNQWLSSGQRIEIYSQQYWWRLLNHLHDIFPTVTSLLGYRTFNEKIGIPYLTCYPAMHWSLNPLGKFLPKWIGEAYKGKWSRRLLQASEVDLAFNDAFTIEQKEPLTLETLPIPGKPESLLGTSLHLQKHLYLFSFPYDFLAFRSELVEKNVEYWERHPLPKLARGKQCTFALWRDRRNDAVWDYLHPIEYQLLMAFKTGSTIEEACETLRTKEVQEASPLLASWFECWVRREWLTKSS